MVNKRHIKAFQGLRGYSILFIFLSHCTYIRNDYGKNCFVWLGGLGVSIFIMLSGYLLAFHNHEYKTHIPYDKIKKSLKRFYPLHIVTFVLSIPFGISAFFDENILKQLIKTICNLILMHAWVPLDEVYFSFNFVSWYLSLTLFFIITESFTLALLKRVNNKMSPFIVISILIFEFFWCFLFQNMAISHWIIYILPAIRYLDYFAGSLALKAVSFFIERKQKLSSVAVIMLGISIILMFALIVLSLNTNSEFFSVAVWFAPSIMMISAVALGDGRSKIIDVVFSNKIIQRIGNISFEIFLIHQLVIRYLREIFNRVIDYNGIIIYFCAFVATIICAEVWKAISNNIKFHKIKE